LTIYLALLATSQQRKKTTTEEFDAFHGFMLIKI